MTFNKRIKESWATSSLFAGNAPFIEELYANYLKNPQLVDARWREYFQSLRLENATDIDHGPIRQAFIAQAHAPISAPHRGVDPSNGSFETKQVHVLQLINAYRFRGHQDADIDPLRLVQKSNLPDLDPIFHQLDETDLDTIFKTGSLAGPERATLRQILSHLRETYCDHVGAEYMHISDTSQKRWLQERLELARSKANLSKERRINLLKRLIAAEGLERYLHTKYVGQKRFSIEGGESMIPLLDCLIQRAGSHQICEMVLGMAHRGRLNVLINVLGKSPKSLFQEFEGHFDPSTNEGSGDVKYHQGFSTDVDTPGGTVHLALAFNPSHLEIISPVVEGSVRARQLRRGDAAGKLVLPVIIHGDAAFAGQGVVMETFNMSQARGYTTGGSIHIIVNNQIGFTTSNPLDARSTQYCSEVARMVQAPILHVNGDDPEAVIFAIELAFDFRMQFSKDVVVDLVCYRRHGHSEADEPAATQPLMYQKIRTHPPVTKLYGQRLINEGLLSSAEIEVIENEYRADLDAGHTIAPQVRAETNKNMVDWTPYRNTSWLSAVDTRIDPSSISRISDDLAQVPSDFKLHPRVAKIMEERQLMGRGLLPVDWGYAETLAYGTLLKEDYSVRISGQDSGRGTFFHRHAVLHCQTDGRTYTPLHQLAKSPRYFTVIDSLLSEEAVLGFEYGFSATDPKCLTVWEAQFGDFANNAQVVIDQFICSGESKWSRLSGLVMFLPHGYDGQGPEHSSARLERYLQLCAEENIQVCVPSVPSQMFHMLRRQMLRPYRKPLIVMTPKSLLRHRDSTSAVSELSQGRFREVIDEAPDFASDTVTRIVFCSGKVYFDLMQERSKRGSPIDTALIRIEQLYPFPEAALCNVVARYSHIKSATWCQEEPRNQGAWEYIKEPLQNILGINHSLKYAGRPPAAAPAVGYLKKHIEQQRQLVDDAFS